MDAVLGGVVEVAAVHQRSHEGVDAIGGGGRRRRVRVVHVGEGSPVDVDEPRMRNDSTWSRIGAPAVVQTLRLGCCRKQRAREQHRQGAKRRFLSRDSHVRSLPAPFASRAPCAPRRTTFGFSRKRGPTCQIRSARTSVPACRMSGTVIKRSERRQARVEMNSGSCCDPDYSARSGAIGSMRLARRPGTHAASVATARSSMETAANVSGSAALTR